MRPFRFAAAVLLGGLLTTAPAVAQTATKWVTAWAAADQGPYPTGNVPTQPMLPLAFPTPAQGATDQSFRMIVRPDIWGYQGRLRFSNVFGTQPVTLDGVYVGLQLSAGALVPRSNRAVAFKGRRSVTIAPGESVWSDPVAFGFVGYTQSPQILGRRLAVSFHVDGSSGPMTWHAAAHTSSYLGDPGGGAHGQAEDDAAFPNLTQSWFFLDAVDVRAPADTMLVAAFGDSITDGTGSTLNGDDRWPDVLSRRLHAAFGERVAVVDEGIGGNRIIGPESYAPDHPSSGGPSAEQRVDRDVLGLSGLGAVVWLEGINDLAAGATPEALAAGMKQVADRLRAGAKGVRIIAGTLTSSLGNAGPHGTAEVDRQRRALNQFIHLSDSFDAVADFDAATLDAQTGRLRAAFVPGDPGDGLHPNRAGYLAMGQAVDLKLLAPPTPRTAPTPSPAAEPAPQ
jgi:lysophospholipase L1-like esterase